MNKCFSHLAEPWHGLWWRMKSNLMLSNFFKIYMEGRVAIFLEDDQAYSARPASNSITVRYAFARVTMWETVANRNNLCARHYPYCHSHANQSTLGYACNLHMQVSARFFIKDKPEYYSRTRESTSYSALHRTLWYLALRPYLVSHRPLVNSLQVGASGRCNELDRFSLHYYCIYNLFTFCHNPTCYFCYFAYSLVLFSKLFIHSLWPSYIEFKSFFSPSHAEPMQRIHHDIGRYFREAPR